VPSSPLDIDIHGDKTMRALAAAMALFLVTSSALAANPKVENALKVLQDISRDPAKMKTFCAMMVINKKMGDKEDPVLEAQIDKLADQLGPAFKAAWDAIDDIEEDSPDGKVLAATIDQLEDKCPN
jgi:hypothetical protein